MGNGKANSYWEAELPPNYDRVGIENFIRAKYVFQIICYYYVHFFAPFLLGSPRSILGSELSGLCDRYEEKRWVSKDGRRESPYSGGVEKTSLPHSRPEERNGPEYSNKSVNACEERKNTLPSVNKETRLTEKISIPAPPKGLEQVQSFCG